MSLIPTPSLQDPNTIVLHNAIEATAYSKIIAIGGFRHKQITIALGAAVGAGDEVDFDFMVSNQHDVDFESAASSTNRWTLCQVKNLLSAVASNGTINMAALGVQTLALNADGCRYLVVKATFIQTGQTAFVTVDLFGAHNEEQS